MTAEQILEKHLLSMLGRTDESYVSVDEMKQQPEWQAVINAMLEYGEIQASRTQDVVGRSSSNDKLVEIAVPENSLILTVNTTKHHNRKLFKEWVKEFFDDDVNFV